MRYFLTLCVYVCVRVKVGLAVRRFAGGAALATVDAAAVAAQQAAAQAKDTTAEAAAAAVGEAKALPGKAADAAQVHEKN